MALPALQVKSFFNLHCFPRQKTAFSGEKGPFLPFPGPHPRKCHFGFSEPPASPLAQEKSAQKVVPGFRGQKGSFFDPENDPPKRPFSDPENDPPKRPFFDTENDLPKRPFFDTETDLRNDPFSTLNRVIFLLKRRVHFHSNEGRFFTSNTPHFLVQNVAKLAREICVLTIVFTPQSAYRKCYIFSELTALDTCLASF